MVGRWHIGFVDPTGGNGLLGQVEGRTAASVPAWTEGHDEPTHPSREQIYRRLERFYASCTASGLPEMRRLATTVSTWRNEIIAGIVSGVSNAGSEGHNRAIKTDARCAYGYRNPVTQRLRARLATTRRGRGHLATRTSARHSQPRQRSKR